MCTFYTLMTDYLHYILCRYSLTGITTAHIFDMAKYYDTSFDNVIKGNNGQYYSPSPIT